MLAAERKPRFVVSLAGAILPLKDVMLAQNRASFEKSGFAPEVVDKAVVLIDAVFSEQASRYLAGNNEPFKASDIAVLKGLDVPAQILEMLDANMKQLFTPWLSYSLTVDARKYAAKAKCPVLAINGEKDTQVDARTNLAAIREAQPKAVVK